MDFSTALSIFGIVLTIIGLFLTVNKTKVINKNSNNKNVSNSFNKVKIVDKTKNINEHHEYHQHQYNTTINSNYSMSKQDSNTNEVFVIGILSFLILGISTFYFIKYKAQIMGGISSITIATLLITLLIINYKKDIHFSHKLYMLFFFFLVFTLVILLNHPFFIPENISFAEKQFNNIKVIDSPAILLELLQNGYQKETYFLMCQIIGIVGIVFLILKYFMLLFQVITNKRTRSIKSLITVDFLIVFLITIFVSGAFPEFLSLLQNTKNN